MKHVDNLGRAMVIYDVAKFTGERAREGHDMQVARDPYYQNMPKHDAAAAALYAAKMGGEDHDVASCDIF